MTSDDDLEAAEEWANKRHGVNPNFPIEVQGDPEDWFNMKDAYLAGIAAGRKESRWVGVDERLPEPYETVLCESRSVPGCYTCAYVVPVGKWADPEEGRSVIRFIKTFKRWRPIPAPPKEGE
jgi:hypothetical protein